MASHECLGSFSGGALWTAMVSVPRAAFETSVFVVSMDLTIMMGVFNGV
jgi:hypothetical protein